MKTLTIITFLLLLPVICVSEVIDATSLETLSQSLKEAKASESEEDIAYVDRFICEATEELNPTDPNDLEVILARLRPRLHKKTVGAVALELRMQQQAARNQKSRKADEFVRQRRETWEGRRAYVHAVVAGIQRDEVLRLLGEPDMKADSVTSENWLYRYDLAHNDEQIWVDTIVVQMADGTVTNVSRSSERRHIEDVIFSESPD